jgi:hypothetical protein
LFREEEEERGGDGGDHDADKGGEEEGFGTHQILKMMGKTLSGLKGQGQQHGAGVGGDDGAAKWLAKHGNSKASTLPPILCPAHSDSQAIHPKHQNPDPKLSSHEI